MRQPRQIWRVFQGSLPKAMGWHQNKQFLRRSGFCEATKLLLKREIKCLWLHSSRELTHSSLLSCTIRYLRITHLSLPPSFRKTYSLKKKPQGSLNFTLICPMSFKICPFFALFLTDCLIFAITYGFLGELKINFFIHGSKEHCLGRFLCFHFSLLR